MSKCLRERIMSNKIQNINKAIEIIKRNRCAGVEKYTNRSENFT